MQANWLTEAETAEAAVTTGGAGRIDQAARESARQRDARRKQIAKERRVLFPLLAGTLLLVPNFGRVTVTGHSMEPTLKDKQNVALLKSYRWFAPLREGDIVVVRKKDGDIAGQEIIKRVVFIQNKTGDKPWPAKITTPEGDIPTHHLFPAETMGYVKVPPGRIYVLGDNLPVSTDSRDSAVGAVSDEEIIGKALFAH